MSEQTPKRYDLITNYRCGSSIEEMELADDGEWVRWESVEAELSALRAEQTRLREALQAYIEELTTGEEMKSTAEVFADARVAARLVAFFSTPTPETTP